MRKKPAVVAFIEKERASGADDKQIRHKLLDAGWHMDIIQHAFEMKHFEKDLSSSSAAPTKSLLKNPALIAAGLISIIIIMALFA